MKYSMTFEGQVWLIGLPSAVAVAMLRSPLPDKMKCDFSVYETLEEASVDQIPDGIIFAAQDGQAQEIRRLVGPKARLVAYQEEPADISEDDLAALDDLWEAPSAERLKFRARLFLQRLVDDYEHWLEYTFWQTTINMVPDLVWYKNLAGIHLEVNDALCKTVKKEKDDVRGQRHGYIWGLSPEEYEKGEFACNESDRQVIESGRMMVGGEQVLDNGELRDLRTYKTPLFDEQGKIFGTAGVAQDITLLNRYHKKILDMAHKDELTGLANRRFFYEYLHEHRKKQYTCLFHIDLDHFKHVNDTYGHQAGDDALKIVSNVLHICFPNDLACRFGGDEFMVLMLGHFALADAEAAAKDFLGKLDDAFQQEDRFKELSASIGVAMTEDVKFPIDELIRRCDTAMYVAKESGRNCVRVFDKSMIK